MYVIKDKETGCYLSERSLYKMDSKGKRWMLLSFTGDCEGMRTYPEHYCHVVMGELINRLLMIGIKKNLEVIKLDTLPIGKMLLSKIKI